MSIKNKLGPGLTMPGPATQGETMGPVSQIAKPVNAFPVMFPVTDFIVKLVEEVSQSELALTVPKVALPSKAPSLT